MNKKMVLPALGLWLLWGILSFASVITFIGDLSTKTSFATAQATQSLFIIAMIFLTSWAYVRAQRSRYTVKEFRALGVFWFILYFAFEFTLWMLWTNPFQMLTQQCNVLKGQTWVFIPLSALCAPYLWGRLYAQAPADAPRKENKDATGPGVSTHSKLVMAVALIAPVYLIHLTQILFFWGRGFGEWRYSIVSIPHVVAVTLAGMLILCVLITPLRRRMLSIISGRATGPLTTGALAIGLAATILFSFAFLSINRSNQRQELDSLFKKLIADPIPSGVTVIDGGWFSWLDSFEDITFKIEKNAFDDFIKSYTLVPEGQISQNHPYPFSKGKGAGFNYYFKEVEYKKDRFYTINLAWDEREKQAFASITDGKYASLEWGKTCATTPKMEGSNDTTQGKKSNVERPSPPPKY